MRRSILLAPLLLCVPGAALAAPLDAGALDEAMAAAEREARRCLSDARGGDAAGGEVVFRAMVGPEGGITDVQIERTSITDAELLTCVARAVERQQVARPDGGGFMPTSRAFVLWDPPTGKKAVKVQAARRLAQGSLDTLDGCLGDRPDRPETLRLDLLIADRTVHPVTGGLPSEWARCVYAAFGSRRVRGTGSVAVHVAWDQEGTARIDRVQTRAADGRTSEDRETREASAARTSAVEPETEAAVGE